MEHKSFRTTSGSLQRSSPPMRLFERAKRLGVWNPSDLDFSADQQDWQRLTAEERDLILRLTALFQSGEEAVTLDLLPLIGVIASEGRVEEELFLTTFLFEEAKHTDFFRRFLDEVAGATGDLHHFHTPSYKAIFYTALPGALQALHTDGSAVAQVRAVVTYNMIVEGVLAETGYHAYHAMLQKQNLLPGTRRGIALLKQDEGRHIAYAVYLLSRLVAQDDALWEELEGTMNALLPAAMGVISEGLDAYAVVPFGLQVADFIDYALGQFQKRLERVRKSRGLALTEINKDTLAYIEAGDA